MRLALCTIYPFTIKRFGFIFRNIFWWLFTLWSLWLTWTHRKLITLFLILSPSQWGIFIYLFLRILHWMQFFGFNWPHIYIWYYIPFFADSLSHLFHSILEGILESIILGSFDVKFLKASFKLILCIVVFHHFSYYYIVNSQILLMWKIK